MTALPYLSPSFIDGDPDSDDFYIFSFFQDSSSASAAPPNHHPQHQLPSNHPLPSVLPIPNPKRPRDEETLPVSQKRSNSVSPQTSSTSSGYEEEKDFDSALAAVGIAAAVATGTYPASTMAADTPPVTGARTGQRRLWVKDRSSDWWDYYSRPDLPDAEFKRAFRMSRATFDFLCDELRPAVAKEDTTLRAAIPVRQRVAVCVWRLATGEPLRLVSRRFGLGISTCHKLVLEVCTAIWSVLMPKAIAWPSPSAASCAASSFETLSGIPGVIGAMYTTHVPIIAPKVSVAAYFNRRQTQRNQKTSYSVTLQGVVNPDGVFTDICIGWPGSMSDDQVLDKSALCQRASTSLIGSGYRLVGGVGYPLNDWILVPYSQRNLTWAQHTFNGKLGEVQQVAKEAFGRLKGRWACLQKRTEVKLQDLPVVLGACCVLHNICELRKEEMEPEQRIEVSDEEVAAENGVRSSSAAQARDAIAHNLLHHGLAGLPFSYSCTCTDGIVLVDFEDKTIQQRKMSKS